jgi:hypothetical protein
MLSMRPATYKRSGKHAGGDKLSLLHVVLLTAFILAGIAALGAWARPWQFVGGNPSLRGVATGTTSGHLVGGCPAGDSKNLINCVQYVDFDAGPIHIHHGPARVTDGFRHGEEDAHDLPVVYDLAHPHRFRLAVGNPGITTRVLGTLWMSFVTLSGGSIVGGMLGGALGGLLSSRQKASGGRHAGHLSTEAQTSRRS